MSGAILLYVGWYLHVLIFTRIKDLGVNHSFSYLDYFDSLLKALIMGLFTARASWIFVFRDQALSAGFGLLPYERVGRDFEWLTTYPWRFFALGEGMLWYILWITIGLTIFIILSVPTFKLISQLKVGKSTVKRGLYFRAFLYLFLLAVYIGFVAYISF